MTLRAIEPAAAADHPLTKAPRMVAAIGYLVPASTIGLWRLLSGAQGEGVLWHAGMALAALGLGLALAHGVGKRLTQLRARDEMGETETIRVLPRAASAVLFALLAVLINGVVLAGMLGDGFLAAAAYPAMGYGLLSAGIAALALHGAYTATRPAGHPRESADFHLALISGSISLVLVALFEWQGFVSAPVPWQHALALVMAGLSGFAMYFIVSVALPATAYNPEARRRFPGAPRRRPGIVVGGNSSGLPTPVPKPSADEFSVTASPPPASASARTAPPARVSEPVPALEPDPPPPQEPDPTIVQQPVPRDEPPTPPPPMAEMAEMADAPDDPATFSIDAPAAAFSDAPDAVVDPFSDWRDAAPPQASRLSFALRGEHTRGTTMLAGSQATLTFSDRDALADVIATLTSPLLDEARANDIAIELSLSTDAGLSVIGPARGKAEFAGSRMSAPVAFVIEAGTQNEISSVHIDFAVRGESVFQMRLEISIAPTKLLLDLVAAVPPAPVPDTLLQDAAGASLPQKQKIQLALQFAGTALAIELTEWLDGEENHNQVFKSQALDKPMLEGLINGIQQELEGCYADVAWAGFDGAAASASRLAAARALRQSMQIVAAGGWRLNDDLRRDPEIAKLLDFVETRGRPGAQLTIKTDDVFLPWEILYPEFQARNMSDAQKAQSPVRAGLFWGARFAIETMKRREGSLVALRRDHLAPPPTASLNFNPTIKLDEAPAETQPIAVQRAWSERLAKRGVLGGLQERCGDMRRVLQDAEQSTSVIYVYCHGSTANVLGGATETLLLDADCRLKPGDVARGHPYPGAPIVILNSCASGVTSPLAFSSFLGRFNERGALGLIATSFSVPIGFAAHFGEALVDLCLKRRGLLAASMLDLRREHLLARGNPVPLFYSVQCSVNFG